MKKTQKNNEERKQKEIEPDSRTLVRRYQSLMNFRRECDRFTVVATAKLRHVICLACFTRRDK